MPHPKRIDIRGAIIGMALGDGSLYRNKYRNGQYGGNYKLDIAHSHRQVEYLKWKLDIVQNLFEYEIPITEKKVLDKYRAFKFCTRVHPRLSFIAKNILVDGKRRITDWALDNITDEGFAIWYMDDGHFRNRKRNSEVHLGTYAFPKGDVEKLRDWIAERYGAEFRLSRNCKYDGDRGWYLWRGISEGHKLLEALKPYTAPGMEYKFAYSFKRGPYNLRTNTAPAP